MCARACVSIIRYHEIIHIKKHFNENLAVLYDSIMNVVMHFFCCSLYTCSRSTKYHPPCSQTLVLMHPVSRGVFCFSCYRGNANIWS